MENDVKHNISFSQRKVLIWLFFAGMLLAALLYFKAEIFSRNRVVLVKEGARVESAETPLGLRMPELDVAQYDRKMREIANIASSSEAAMGQPKISEGGWPVSAPYPNAGAILPFNRIVAYYGNLYSRGMGILGEYSEDEVLKRLNVEVEKWNKADPGTQVVPALHYIAVVAQKGAGPGGLYRARMPDKEIDKVLAMARKINGLVFLDIQVGKSTVKAEVPHFEKYLKLSNVHLGIDPEFSMKSGAAPGTEIGTLDAADINFAAEYLARLVRENNLTPKVLVIHRFTQKMVTNYKGITPLPEVQVVMDMDGFGSRGSKKNTYKQYIYKEPVQFTGFKLFYKNDYRAGGLLSPEDLLKLQPIPSYIQYQ